ncbi:MAG: glutamate ligase domain-containing protein, partial [Cellulomonadaceae bacterium]
AVLTFGTVTGAQVRADDVRVDASGHASFQLGAPGEQSAAVHLQLVGAHHVVNALAAAAVGLSLGLTAATVAERLSAATAVSPHRMQVTERPDGVTVIDDSYNANPDSMRAALRALATVAGRTRRSIAVLVEMLELGEASRERHDEIGRLAVRLNIDLLVVVGAGAWAIFDGAQMEGSWGEEVVQVADPQAAEELLHDTLRTGDVVLVKGSNGTGLWRLGDRLAAAGTEDRP